jgi:hypothetical protein
MTKKKAEEDKLKRGRKPMEFDEEIADKILDQLANGTSLRAICLQDDMPDGFIVRKWLARNPDFARQYAYARDEQADSLFDETIFIADNLPEDATSEQIQAARLQIDTRKWMAGKIRPKKYGDSTKLDAQGEVQSLTMQQINIGKLDFEDREALANMLKAIAPPTISGDDL